MSERKFEAPFQLTLLVATLTVDLKLDNDKTTDRIRALSSGLVDSYKVGRAALATESITVIEEQIQDLEKEIEVAGRRGNPNADRKRRLMTERVNGMRAALSIIRKLP
jgi:hypothetical protein